jgi:hypothetical protein
MSDLVRRAKEVKSIVSDGSLPKSRRVPQALQALGGLTLTGLPIDERSTLEANLVNVNRILARYQLETFEAYDQMKDTDLQQVLDILAALASQIGKAN